MEPSRITYSQELHWRLAAKWNELPFEEFISREGEDQSRMVAAYETASMIDAVTAQAAKKPGKRQVQKVGRHR